VRAAPELAEVHPACGVQLACQVRRDEEAGDHEEDVDADVAAAQPSRPEVIQNDGQHRDRAQPLHVGMKFDPTFCAADVRVRRRAAEEVPADAT
jgi:hypothetical protein